MNIPTPRILAEIALLLFVAPFCLAQMSELTAKELIRNSECNRTAVQNVEFTRITRREDLEDTLLDFEIAAHKREYERPFIFEVSETGNFRDSSGKIVTVTSTGIRTRLVAITRNLQKVFPLHGCTDAEGSFSELIAQTHIGVNRKAEAERFAWFRYILVEDPQNQRFIVNSRQLRHVFEDFFFNKFPEREAKKKFKVWSKNYERIEKNLVMGTTSEETTNGFSASITYFMGSSDGVPRLFRATLDVNKAGQYTVRDVIGLLP